MKKEEENSNNLYMIGFYVSLSVLRASRSRRYEAKVVSSLLQIQIFAD